MVTQVPDEQLRNNFGTRNTHPTGEGETEGDRYQNDGTGALAAGKWWYHDGAWQLVGGGSSTTTAENMPRDFHELTSVDAGNSQNGISSQRSTVYSQATGRVYHGRIDHSTARIYLDIEEVSEDADSSQQFNFYEGYIQGIINYEEVPLTPNEYGICLVISQDDDEDPSTSTLHIIFNANDGVTDDIYDMYILESAITGPPDEGIYALPAPQYAERVNQTVGGENPCYFFSAAAAPDLSAGEGIVVVYTQSGGGAQVVYANYYDSSGLAPGSRYDTAVTAYAELVISPPLANAYRPTVEVDSAYMHCAYMMEEDGTGNIRLFYARGDIAGIAAWTALPSAAPVDANSASYPLNNNLNWSPTMVTYPYGASGDVIVGILSSDDAENVIPLFQFSNDIVNPAPNPVGVPSSWAEQPADIFNVNQYENTMNFRCGYQLGASPTENENVAPIIYFHKYVREYDINTVSQIIGYTPYPLDEDASGRGINQIPVHLGIDAQDWTTAHGWIYPKIAYQPMRPGRTVREENDGAWYPPMLALRSRLYWPSGGTDWEALYYLVSKTLPSYSMDLPS